MLLGCIADDFTGATDLASMLVRGGMRTIQTIGIPPDADDVAARADAVVISLKSRTTPAADAIAESLHALRWLRERGAKQIFFKYCSTFDSTAAGNIGPVADALMEALDASFTIACPAFPENGRSVYRGHLFVNDTLLSESGMEKHPLTPMTDSNLVRVLQAQSTHTVGLARYDAVAQGASALRDRFDALRAGGVGIAIVDALSNADLHAIGEACADLELITGGSGIAIGLPNNFVRSGRLRDTSGAAVLPEIEGYAAVLSGSCSKATNGQVEHWIGDEQPAFRIDPLALHAGEPVVAKALAWIDQQLEQAPVLLYATSRPEDVAQVQAQLGVEAAGLLVENALAEIARGLVARGVRRLVVAGGETSGAVVKALGVRSLRVGPMIDPGVPWMTAEGGDVALALALKSGNFGTIDFFSKALAQLDSPESGAASHE